MSRTRSARATAPRAPVGLVVAVTGANDYLAVGLIRRLEGRGDVARVVALDTRVPAGLGTKTRFLTLDLTEPGAGEALAGILEREGVAAVAHLAFLSNPTHHSSWAHELESLGTANVLAACAGRVRKLVMRSHTCVYGADPSNPNYLTEDRPLHGNPRSRFVSDKVDAERQAARFADAHPEVVVTVLRACSEVGAAVRSYVTRYFSRRLALTLLGFDPLLQFVHLDDLLDAYERVLLEDHPGAFNIVGGGVLPLSRALKLAGVTQVPVPHLLAYPLVHALWTAQAVEAPAAFLDYLRYLWLADGDKARRVLRFRPRYATTEAFLAHLRERRHGAATAGSGDDAGPGIGGAT